MNQCTETQGNPPVASSEPRASLDSPALAADRVGVIAPGNRVPLPTRAGQEGFFRETCVEESGIWAGFAASEPGSANPWHHHAAHTVYVLALSGEGALEFDGPDGVESVPLCVDGTLYVIPPRLVHREVNTGTTRHQVFMFRVGHGPGTLAADAPAARK